ncbi:MAG: outer rane chaperone Skp (OmpH) [Bacteroidota bacterium]|jgi:outer membrane protein|nr:outer rane chaperone Skp (OmpH) [Bacteroidota bacterium]
MNKNVSIILNVILFIAVGVLFYFHFSSCNDGCAAPAGTNDSTMASKPVVADPKDIKASKIVYVNIDQLNEKYQFLKDISDAAKSEHTNLQGQYQSKGEKLQRDYEEFQQSAQGGLLSDNQINTKQEEFAKRKEDLDQLQMKADALMEKIQAQSMQAMENVKNYIAEYNKKSNYDFVVAYSDNPGTTQLLLANPAYDITNEIIEGLNAQYTSEKAAKGKK